jgi:protein transport protein SEC24
MMSLPCARIAPLLYPRLMSLRKALDGTEPIEHLPDGMVLSSEGLEQGGIFLLENGIEALLHLDKNVDPALVHQLLNLSSYDEMLRVPGSLALVPNDSPASKAMQDLLIKVGSAIIIL